MFPLECRFCRKRLAPVICGNGWDGAKTRLCLQVRIWARTKAIEARQGNYALNVTGSILRFYEQYYSAKYPLPKSGRSATLLGALCHSGGSLRTRLPLPVAAQTRSPCLTSTLGPWRTGAW